MSELLVRNARVLTLSGAKGPRRGKALSELGVSPETDVRVEGGVIAEVGRDLRAAHAATMIDAKGKVLMPGFVDCHTHACWAGDRLDEWQMRLRGVPYLDILKSGGGILSTVRAVRAASPESLVSTLRDRLERMLGAGTTTVEIKSGYGLDTATELKMLRAIRSASREMPGTVVATALIGHAVEGDHDASVSRAVNEILPATSREFPGIMLDAFCEKGAWTREDCVRLFEAGLARGHRFRVHADQFNSLGIIADAVRLGAVSVDHLEASTDADLALLANSTTFGVIIPCTGFHTDQRYARARGFIDAGGALALATNCNPGSAPTHAMPFAIALASRFCGLSPAEAIVAATVNAAIMMGFSDRGTIEVGQRADLLLLRHRDERLLAYEVGENPVEQVIVGGRVAA